MEGKGDHAGGGDGRPGGRVQETRREGTGDQEGGNGRTRREGKGDQEGGEDDPSHVRPFIATCI